MWRRSRGILTLLVVLVVHPDEPDIDSGTVTMDLENIHTSKCSTKNAHLGEEWRGQSGFKRSSIQ